MSERDRSFAKSLGMTVADVATALGRSRQTVHRGFQSSHDYLKVDDLAQVVAHRRLDEPEEQKAREAVQAHYPDLVSAVLKIVDAASYSDFIPGAAGEYWFVCADFLHFRANLTRCAEQLDSLCVADGAQVKLFVGADDYEWAEAYAGQQPMSATEAIQCSHDLRLMPFTLLRIDVRNDIDIFCVTEEGFAPLSRMEASRLRVAIQQMLLKPAKEKAAARVQTEQSAGLHDDADARLHDKAA